MVQGHSKKRTQNPFKIAQTRQKGDFLVKEPNIDLHETWCTDVTIQEDDKKVIKSEGHCAYFHVTMLTNTAI